MAWFVQFRCLFDLYIGKFCSLIGFHLLRTEFVNLAVSGGWFLLTVWDYPAMWT